MTSVKNKTDEDKLTSSLPLRRRALNAKEHRTRTASAGSPDVQLITRVRDMPLIQASEFLSAVELAYIDRLIVLRMFVYVAVFFVFLHRSVLIRSL